MKAQQKERAIQMKILITIIAAVLYFPLGVIFELAKKYK